VPSLRERQGDFSQGTARLFNPVTGQEFTDRKIPTNLIDPTALAILKLFPEPTIPATTPGVDPNRILAVSPAVNNTRQETFRIDHSINSKHQLTGRFTYDLSQTVEPGGLFQGTSFTVPGIATTSTNVPGKVLSVSLVSSFGSNKVNEATFAYSSNDITDTLDGIWNKGNVTIPNSELFPENNSDLPPTIAITGFSSLGSGQLIGIHYKNFNPKDNFTWVKNSHTFKFGADLSWERKNENAANVTQGNFGFTGTQTARTGVSG